MVAKTKQLSKVCKKCDKRKRINQFTKQAITKDGLKPYCTTCVEKYNKKYYQAHRVKLLDRSIGRYYDNKEKQDGSE